MRAFAVIVSEDDNSNIRQCPVEAKRVVILAQVPGEKEKNEGKVAIGVAPIQRDPSGMIAIPQNALWFGDVATAGQYLKGIVEDKDLPDVLKLKPLTKASGVLFFNVFADPVVINGILDVQVHAYPDRYMPLHEWEEMALRVSRVGGEKDNVVSITTGQPVEPEVVSTPSEE